MKTANFFLIGCLSIPAIGCAVTPQRESSGATNAQSNNAVQNSTVVENANKQSNVSAPVVQKNAPDALVKDLYRQHDANESPFNETKDRALIDKFFVKNLADLIWKDNIRSNGGIGAVEFDPLYDAQDTDFKKFSKGKTKIENDNATVTVGFENFGEKKTITYVLRQKNGDWKIADIKYAGGGTLLSFYTPNSESGQGSHSDAPTDGFEFEGTYQVGTTTCTVRPVKMAFEVRWAKGTGSMMLFADGDNHFVSENSRDGQDVFIFDDDSLTTGKFTRADGKEMPVKKIK